MVLIFLPMFWPVIPLVLLEAAGVFMLAPYTPVTAPVSGVKVLGPIVAALLIAFAF
jgi:hypothetical protein